MSETAPTTTRGLSVDAGRLRADLEALGGIGRTQGGGLSRTSFSPADLAARAWFTGRCRDAGLDVRTDGIGNLIVSSPELDRRSRPGAAVWTGSHIDTVPNGGAFDGALGTVAALEVLRRLHEEGMSLARPVRAVVYTDEEGSYAHLLGSTALIRGYSKDELEALTGRDGDRFVDTFAAAGGNPGDAVGPLLQPGDVHASVELHIEQGPTLERMGTQIGIVTGIVGIGGGVITFSGRADHAGTTPMGARKDAAVAAGAFVAALPGIAPEVSPDAVVTCGILRLEPGGSNVIPSAAHATVDFRDRSDSGVGRLDARIRELAEHAARAAGVDVAFEFEPPLPAAPMHDSVRAAIASAVAGRGYTSVDLPSGAGHDSQNLEKIAPTGMIFVPSVDGRSHCPEERTDWPDVTRGANVLLDTVIALAGA